jgi:hypothetical protein
VNDDTVLFGVETNTVFHSGTYTLFSSPSSTGKQSEIGGSQLFKLSLTLFPPRDSLNCLCLFLQDSGSRTHIVFVMVFCVMNEYVGFLPFANQFVVSWRDLTALRLCQNIFILST